MTLLHQKLVNWYQENRRTLPWRTDKNPYKIWVSEVMLQQTTVVAVIPYFERFLKRFDTVKALANAPLEDVLEHWSGLGYYSRARNLHKSAQAINEKKAFPATAEELLKLPGFGPYTSRAVASIAFDQAVGVLDGNVIRVLCRVFGLSVKWWTNEEKLKLQKISDKLAAIGHSSDVNQGLMELGATVCTPQKPMCLLCPWKVECVGFKKNLVNKLPLKKPRKSSECWIWTPYLVSKSGKWAFIENNYAPFLKKQWIFPGEIKIQKTKPKAFDLLHRVTHHDIYVNIKSGSKNTFKNEKGKLKWFSKEEIKKVNPSSLLQKILHSPSF